MGALSRVAGLNYFIHRTVPQGWEIPASLGSALSMLGYAAEHRSDLRGYGLRSDNLGTALRTGTAIGLLGGAVAAGSAFVPASRQFFRGDMIVSANGKEAAYHTLLRIPLATAATEELIFRTALESVLARGRAGWRAALLCSMAFGAWHVLPAIDRLQHNPGVEEFRRHHPLSKAAVVATAVGATTLAGLGLSFVRARTRSILPPMLLHASVNAGAYGAGWLAYQRERRVGEVAVA